MHSWPCGLTKAMSVLIISGTGSMGIGMTMKKNPCGWRMGRPTLDGEVRTALALWESMQPLML